MTKRAMTRLGSSITGCILAMCVVIQQSQAQDSNAIPQRLRPILDEAEAAISNMYRETEPRQIAEAQTNLNDSLDSLASLVDEQLIQRVKPEESNSIEAKLVLM